MYLFRFNFYHELLQVRYRLLVLASNSSKSITEMRNMKILKSFLTTSFYLAIGVVLVLLIFSECWRITEKLAYLLALNNLEKNANCGSANAQTQLGILHLRGQDNEQDLPRATFWLRHAARQNHAGAQFSLGLMHQTGSGLTRSDKHALYWYSKAAEQNFAASEFHLGYMYEWGVGVEPDQELSFKWYEKAARKGYASAQYKLGLIYSNVLAKRRNHLQAIHWLRQAALQGLSSAQFSLGMSYLRGDGISKDLFEGYKWILMASFVAGKNSFNSKDLVSDQLTEEQIEEAKKYAWSWQPSNLDHSISLCRYENLLARPDIRPELLTL